MNYQSYMLMIFQLAEYTPIFRLSRIIVFFSFTASLIHFQPHYTSSKIKIQKNNTEKNRNLDLLKPSSCKSNLYKSLIHALIDHRKRAAREYIARGRLNKTPTCLRVTPVRSRQYLKKQKTNVRAILSPLAVHRVQCTRT